ncbi:MAG: S-layer homology domain-containing protein [Clostridia bacterium]|nr:S-layer homology domain-containing protein [Clostridia bacterium]
MGNLKQILSGTLAAVLAAGMMSTGIAAKSYDDVASTDDFAEQIGILSDIGVIKGTSETEFSPEDSVTREQMALLLFRLMIGKDSAGTLNTTAFTDLYDETYHGAISWANASGYIIGTSDTTFEPTEGITLQDAMTMLVRALGHSSLQMNAGYPWTYIDAAVKLGLDDGLEDLRYTKELTRAEVAGMLYNALTAEYLIPKTASNGMTFYESTTIIERVFDYEIEESVIVATNDFAIEGLDTVTKDGYITVRTEDGLLTVKFDELGLEGTANENLGKNVKLVFKNDPKTKLVSVLGCTELGKSEDAGVINVGKDNAYIEIGGVKYQVVETLSDTLATNANELLVYAYDNDGTLTQVTANADLAAMLGAFDAQLIFDDKNSDTADRLIIKSYAFGQLKINGGKVNLAGNLKESDLTITNPNEAANGDYVLYYFNEGNKTLELAALLPVSESAAVTRLTSTTATIGGTRYNLGNEKLGITAASIREQLTVGEKVRIVVLNGAIIAVDSSSTSIFAPSQYLIAESTTTPTFINGKFGYVMEANIDGVTETIFVTNKYVEVGKVYRYTTDSADNFTLIPYTVSGGVINSGNDEFVQSNSQNDDIAFIIENADGSSIVKSNAHYTLSKGNADAVSSTGLGEPSISFVTDSNTIIIVNNNGTISTAKGVYTSSIHIADGASVTAIFSNEVGNVETLRYLYISDGSLGSVDSTASSVKILAKTGSELIDGKVYTIYTVLDLANGKVDSMMSLNNGLIVGKNYLTRIDGLISADEANIKGGIVTGYTGTTITLGGETYKLASNATLVKLNTSDNTTDSINLKDTYMNHVEIIIENDAVKSVILLDAASFKAVHADGKITITANESLVDMYDAGLLSLELVNAETEETTPISVAGFGLTVVDSAENFTLEITPDVTLEPGFYTIGFEVGGVEFEAIFNVK